MYFYWPISVLLQVTSYLSLKNQPDQIDFGKSESLDCHICTLKQL